jgi:hypothetical protein
MPIPRKPEPAEPEVEAYTWTFAGNPEVVLCFEHSIGTSRVEEALRTSMNRNRQSNERLLTIVSRGNHVVLVDKHRSHAPNRLRTRGEQVAAYLGYSAKFVPPPRR